MDSHDLISGSQNPPQDVEQGEQTSEEMDFEMVSLSEGQRSQMKRSSSYEEALILENSSDFCNGLYGKSHDSSTQDSNFQPQGKSLNDVHDTDTTSRGSTITAEKENEEKQCLEKENESKKFVGNEEKDLPMQKQSIEMGSPLENAATRDITRNDQRKDIGRNDTSSTTRNDPPQKVHMKDTSSTAADDQTLHTERKINTDGKFDARDGVNNNQPVPPTTNKPQDSSSQNEGVKDEINDSVTISRENSVYQPTWKGVEQEVAGLEESLETLEMRKRKSPDRENPGDPKKRHVSENQSDDNGIGKEQGRSESGAEEEKDRSTDDEEDEDDEEENANAGQNASKKKKRHGGQKKKKKLEYQKKKGQLQTKPSGSKANGSELSTVLNVMAEERKQKMQETPSSVLKTHDMQWKTEDVYNKDQMKINEEPGQIKKERNQQQLSNESKKPKDTKTNHPGDLGQGENVDKNGKPKENPEKGVNLNFSFYTSCNYMCIQYSA